ncbi:Alpha-galactosidase [Anaerohalosphaera lusitana]|uniref:Alpha-galactosidase n=1 Tax=Anaerohalosphaera lusitana TaxID=1936003 RepID=A0A1U9NIH4_9BACT|nr:alpha-galactosidase [Anaerohalosphaera lusitana]AQT67742.1 Alpha-galactosidase [Anaerohalosphaera lusitana]
MSKRAFLMLFLLSCVVPSLFAAEWVGSEPGKPKTSQDGNAFILQNDVISASWKIQDDSLKPEMIVNKITGRKWSQQNTSLFKISTVAKDAPKSTDWLYLGIQVKGNSVDAVISHDGDSWTVVKSYPRTDFPGRPTAVRLGKMDLQASLNDYVDIGQIGTSYYTDFEVSTDTDTRTVSFDDPGWRKKVSKTEGTRIDLVSEMTTITAAANTASFIEKHLPQNVTAVQCRIKKGTDKAMSWSPGIALVWEDGRFILLNRRTAQYTFDVSSKAGEAIIQKKPQQYPAFNITSEDFSIKSFPKLSIAGHKGTVRARIKAVLKHKTRPLEVDWTASLREDSNYVRETLTLSTDTGSTAITGLELFDRRITGAQQVGRVPGSPVANDSMFFGVELPVTTNVIDSSGFKSGFACKLTVDKSNAYTFSTVAGTYPEGQLRRSFLYYLERERANPYHAFLHYNCWYDLGLNPTESGLIEVIKAYEKNLIDKYDVQIDSFVIDDGWDDFNVGLWEVDKKKFPNGFAPVKKALDSIDSHLGIWISPLGGYSGAGQRTEHAKNMGLISHQLDLSEPGYYKWYRDECLSLMNEYGVNYFKWDRAGSGVSPHFMALLRLARDLRKENPDVFINVTVGTWPSPFWLNHVDSTWRSGADVGWTGKGDIRERWITFRDAECYNRVVKQAPLYPLSSIMHHGLVLGYHFQGKNISEAGADLKNEARSYFAAGPNLQELYLSPDLMTDAAWKQVAQAYKWYEKNEDIMADTHWVGGNPAVLEPYGWASWSADKAVLGLRNPDDQEKTIKVDLDEFFELPDDAPSSYKLQSPYKDQRIQKLELHANQPHALTLKPFEVLVFDALPTQ